MTDATLAMYTPAPFGLSRALRHDLGRVVRDLVLPLSCNPLTVMKLFVLVACDVLCWFVVCCLFI
jgi:hypothetical protein